jgi:hypothetical protein
MVEVEMDQAQLIRCIEQQLENLAHFDAELAYQYEDDLYSGDDMDEPIVDKFTLTLLAELEQIVYALDCNDVPVVEVAH